MLNARAWLGQNNAIRPSPAAARAPCHVEGVGLRPVSQFLTLGSVCMLPAGTESFVQRLKTCGANAPWRRRIGTAMFTIHQRRVVLPSLLLSNIGGWGKRLSHAHSRACAGASLRAAKVTASIECSMIDSTKVPAASKTFAPPFATEDAGPWSSVYSERFGFGETWFEHMRRPSSHSEIPPSQTDGGGLLEGPCSEQVKTDSQKMDSLPQSSSTSVEGSGGTALLRNDSEVVQVGDDVALDDWVLVDRSQEGGLGMAGAAPAEGWWASRGEQDVPRHRPAGRSLAWKETTPATALHPDEEVQEVPVVARGIVHTTAAKAVESSRDVSECLQRTFPHAQQRRMRGVGQPPMSAGVAAVGEPFIRRQMATTGMWSKTEQPGAAKTGKAPGSMAKAGGGGRAAGSRSASAARVRERPSAMRSLGDSYTTYSDTWYAKRDSTFGRDLQAFQRVGTADRSKPLPMTKNSGIALPQSQSKGLTRQATSSQRPVGRRPSSVINARTAAVPAVSKSRELQAGAAKRKALQHGRPQGTGASKMAVMNPVNPDRDDTLSYGRVTAVPGLSLLQATRAPESRQHPGQEAPAPLALAEKSFPAKISKFAGSGGGRAHDEVLAMVAPNLLLDSRPRVEATQRPASAQPLASAELAVSSSARPGTGSTVLRSAGLGSWDMPTCKAGGLRRSEFSAAMLRSSVGEILTSPLRSFP